MSYYAVTRAAGPAWSEGGINDQPQLGDHAVFMNALAEDGVLLLAGPLAGTEYGRLLALLVFNVDSEADVHQRLADDPWRDRLQITSIEPWNIIVGAERLSSRGAAAATGA